MVKLNGDNDDGYSLSQASELALNEYLQLTRETLIEVAHSRNPKAKELGILDISRAIEQHAAKKLPEPNLQDQFPPALKVYAILAVIFAGLGLWAALGAGGGEKLIDLGFLDIAKIFAGAIVGSATVAKVGTTKKANESRKADS